jgi:protein-L-isoaspartate(D-aspartate) O-methyltransferase
MDIIDLAFDKYKRSSFLPAETQHFAGEDRPLPLGYGQTNSQPSTVRLMLEWLDVQAGDKVLDVGSGSGWTTALLSFLVGEKGSVYAVEKVPQLVEFGINNCQKFSIENVQFHQAGKSFGLPQFAPYNRILVSAAATELPQDLIKQLNIGGKMVIPIEHTIHIITKVTHDTYEQVKKPGYVFVPLL